MTQNQNNFKLTSGKTIGLEPKVMYVLYATKTSKGWLKHTISNIYSFDENNEPDIYPDLQTATLLANKFPEHNIKIYPVLVNMTVFTNFNLTDETNKN